MRSVGSSFRSRTKRTADLGRSIEDFSKAGRLKGDSNGQQTNEEWRLELEAARQKVAELEVVLRTGWHGNR